MPKTVILNHSVYIVKFIEFNFETGEITEIEEQTIDDGCYNQFEDKTYWGYFWYEKAPYFFHGTNVYPIFDVGNKVKIEYISDTEAKFLFFKDGVLLEQTLYPRVAGDDWRDEKDMDVFHVIKTLSE